MDQGATSVISIHLRVLTCVAAALAAQAVCAAPPSVKSALPSAATDPYRSTPIVRPSVNSVPGLDLRPPSAIDLAPTHFPMARSATGFGSLLRSGVGSREISRLPDGNQPHGRIPGRAEEFAQRLHHEGLPLARLWENHSAMVSLGLNSKGKPGLWLVQKLH